MKKKLPEKNQTSSSPRPEPGAEVLPDFLSNSAASSR
jgi:hypothetical protein